MDSTAAAAAETALKKVGVSICGPNRSALTGTDEGVHYGGVERVERVKVDAGDPDGAITDAVFSAIARLLEKGVDGAEFTGAPVEVILTFDGPRGDLLVIWRASFTVLTDKPTTH